MQYIDVLEGLKSNVLRDKLIKIRRRKIQSKFRPGVKNDQVLHRTLASKYAERRYLEAPPTVEELRFLVK